MRRARSIWSRRRHNLAEAWRAESVTAAVDPPLSARQGSGLASRARTRAGGAIALSGATGAFDRPAPAFRSLPEPGRRRSPAPSGLEDSERGVAEGSGDRDRSGGEPAGPWRHFSMQCSCISCGFHAGAGDFSPRKWRADALQHRDRIPTSRPLRAGSRAPGLALDHADGLGRCLYQAASRYRFARPPTPDGDAARSPWRRSQAPSSPRSPAREHRGCRGRPRSRRRKGTWSQRLSSRSSQE